MPCIGGKYVLFLSKEGESPDGRVLTGYELSPEGVTPLDVARHFDAYKGMDEVAFLNTVRDVIKQETSKTIERRRVPTDPLDISSGQISVGKDKSVRLNEKFEGSDDWLSEIVFELTNTSKKDIIFFELHVNFPETKSSGNEMSYGFYFGLRPGVPGPKAEPLSLMPDQNLTVAFADKYDRMKSFLEKRHTVESLRKVELVTGFVVFSDGTAWIAASFYRQDPDNPRRYIPIKNVPD